MHCFSSTAIYSLKQIQSMKWLKIVKQFQIHCQFVINHSENHHFQVHPQNVDENESKETLQQDDKIESNEQEIKDENNSTTSPIMKSSSTENVSVVTHSSISVSDMNVL